MRVRWLETNFFNCDVARIFQTKNINPRVEAAEAFVRIFTMAISLKQVITVVPLRRPREKLWAKGRCEREKAGQMTDVLEKLKEAEDRKSVALSWPGRDKNETDSRPTASSLKGFARESPGTWC